MIAAKNDEIEFPISSCGAELALPRGREAKLVPRILIVDDDAAVRALLRVIAERQGLEVDETADGNQCLDLVARNVYDLVVLDLGASHRSGFDLIDCLRRKADRPAVIVVAAFSRWGFVDVDPDMVHCIMRKPFDLDLIAATMASTARAIHDRRGVRSALRPFFYGR